MKAQLQRLARLQFNLTKMDLLVIVPMVLATGISIASTAGGGTTGAEFQGLYNMLIGWATGYFGRSLAIGAFLMGIIMGFAGKIMLALTGVAFAIILTLGPGIIDGMFAALI